MLAARTWAWLVVVAGAAVARAEDWPTFRHDNHRSGKTAERLSAESLERQWTWQSPQPPQPAWAGPAKWDAFANLKPLRSMRNYDPAFHPIAVGGSVYFGSSVDDSVHCLDAASGKEKWSYTTDGPVRIAPAYVDGRLYFGSDDGRAYCLRAEDGRLVWRHRPVPAGRRILNNGRLISPWPCRTGVLVAGDTAYFGAGMLPWKESYLCAVDARTGKPEGPGRYVRPQSGVTMEGALLASQRQLFSPQGRVPPLLFDRAGGKSLGSLDNKGGGGCFVLVTDDRQVYHGPGNKTGWISQSNAQTRERLASFSGGNEMIVDGDTAYLLSDYRLAAMDRRTKKARWSKPCEYPYTLILAGGTLFAGGRDAVAALRAKDGKLLWEGEVPGRAYGLAVAGGRLLVSTDEGAVCCFRRAPKPATAKTVAESPQTDEKPLEAVRPIEDKALAGRWVFQGQLVRDATVEDLAGSLDGAIQGPVRLQRIGNVEALAADGNGSVLLAEDHTKADLPTREISAETWVRVDEPLTWGGIIGAVQDNGSYERGWLLGYNGSRFSFAVCGKQGPGNLTYLAAGPDFQPGTWHHVVGTYDGREMRVYVDGQLKATSTAQKGPIDYPPQAFYEIGAYHDKDEFFRLTGMIHEVRVYRRVLRAEEVRKHHQSKRLGQLPASKPEEPITLAVGPYLKFTGPDAAVVRWQTRHPSPTILEYGSGKDVRKVEDPKPKTSHRAELHGLRHNTVYRYVIKVLAGNQPRATEKFECDTFFNFSPAVLPDASHPDRPQDMTGRLYARAAEHVLSAGGVREGICLVIGSGDGRLASQLAGRSRLRVIGVDTDADAVAAARRRLKHAGTYGSRVSVQQVDSFDRLPFVGDFANLVVSQRVLSEGKCVGKAAEVLRLLRPGGGVALLGQPPATANELSKAALEAWCKAGDVPATIRQDKHGLWAQLVRAPLEDIGVWSHQYGLPDNSAYGGESLEGARSADDLAVQWVGRPGPRAQADRNGRKPSPLSVGGRLLMQGLHRIIALDAYNGTILWSLEIPDFERFNVPRDCSNWCADRRHVFAAVRDKCWRIDAADGKVSKFYPVIAGPKDDWDYDWGYLASHEDGLIGSAVKQGTSWTNFFGGDGWYDARSGPGSYKICSDRLFSLDKQSGKVRWTYARGLVINPTITVGAGRVWFVECRNAKAIGSDQRRLGMAELWQDQFLVALDVKTGRKLWETPIDTADGLVVFYLAYADGRLVLVSSDEKYHVYAFDANDGAAVWDVDFDWSGKDHGKHMSRPAIVGGKVYVRPRVIDLATGKIQERPMPGGGCGTYAATEQTLIFRDGNVTLWDFRGNKKSSWQRLRPGCWLSTIPAAGMLLSPEGGGGCSCGNWMETSIGFMPKRAQQ